MIFSKSRIPFNIFTIHREIVNNNHYVTVMPAIFILRLLSSLVKKNAHISMEPKNHKLWLYNLYIGPT